MPPLIVLRPEPGARATAARAVALGLRPIVCPLFEAVACDWAAPDPGAFDGVMMSSANAARLGGEALTRFVDLPLYAVGAATAAAARVAGFAGVREGAGDVQALVGVIQADGATRVLHLAGRDRTPFVAPFEVVTCVVYASETIPAPDLPSEGVALLHSARAAARFAALAEKKRFSIVAISAAVAQAAGAGWQRIETAAAPDDASMLALAARLCKA